MSKLSDGGQAEAVESLPPKSRARVVLPSLELLCRLTSRTRHSTTAPALATASRYTPTLSRLCTWSLVQRPLPHLGRVLALVCEVSQGELAQCIRARCGARCAGPVKSGELQLVPEWWPSLCRAAPQRRHRLEGPSRVKPEAERSATALNEQAERRVARFETVTVALWRARATPRDLGSLGLSSTGFSCSSIVDSSLIESLTLTRDTVLHSASPRPRAIFHA